MNRYLVSLTRWVATEATVVLPSITAAAAAALPSTVGPSTGSVGGTNGTRCLSAEGRPRRISSRSARIPARTTIEVDEEADIVPRAAVGEACKVELLDFDSARSPLLTCKQANNQVACGSLL